VATTAGEAAFRRYINAARTTPASAVENAVSGAVTWPGPPGACHQGQQNQAHREGQATLGIEQTREFGDRTGSCLGLDQPHQAEQQGNDQTMGQHLRDHALQAQGCCGGESQQQKSHMPNGAVGDQLAHVELGDRIEGAIDGADGSHGSDPGGPGCPGIGQEFNAEAQQAIGAEFRHCPRQHHGHRCRSFAVGEGLPSVQRHNGELEAKGQQHQRQDPALLT